MDYLDHHSVLMDAEFLATFEATTRSKIVDLILVIAQDVRDRIPEAGCALIAIGPAGAALAPSLNTGCHMLCVLRPELERHAHRMFSDDLAKSVVATMFGSH